MSVSNIERVNMNSQCTETLLRLKATMSSVAGSSISAKRPCGAISSAISARCRSVPVVENTKAGAPSPSAATSAASGLEWSTT